MAFGTSSWLKIKNVTHFASEMLKWIFKSFFLLLIVLSLAIPAFKIGFAGTVVCAEGLLLHEVLKHISIDSFPLFLNGKTGGLELTYVEPRLFFQLYGEWLVSASETLFSSLATAVKASVIAACFAPFGFMFLDAKANRPKWTRGAKMTSPWLLMLSFKLRFQKTYFKFGSIKMPVKYENLSTFVIGSPGCGKSETLSFSIAKQAIDRAMIHEREAGHIVMIYDFKTDFVTRFYDPENPNHFIFNPLDKRCVKWNQFNEIDMTTDIVTMSDCRIPSSKGGEAERFFNSTARSYDRAIIAKAMQKKAPNNSTYKGYMFSDLDTRKEMLEATEEGREALVGLGDPKGKQADGVFATHMLYGQGFKYLDDAPEGETFGINKALRGNEPMVIFVTNLSEQKDALAPVIGFFLDLFNIKGTGHQKRKGKKIFNIWDEFITLNPLNSIQQLIDQGREAGFCNFFFLQSEQTLKDKYNPKIAEAIFGGCGTKVFFRNGTPETQKFVSDYFGEAWFEEQDETITTGDGVRQGRSSRKTETKKLLISKEEVKALRPGEFLLEFPSQPVVKIRGKRYNPPKRQPPFVIKDGLTIVALKLERERLKNRIEAAAEAKKEEKGIEATEIEESMEELPISVEASEEEREKSDKITSADIDVILPGIEVEEIDLGV